jgi:broad specificity phosphatase PhoE
MRARSIVAALMMIVALAGCNLVSQVSGGQSSPPVQPSAPAVRAQWSFFVVRHAERADDGNEDPPLTSEGEQRAERLAQMLADKRGVAVYATRYQRTQATARPTAEAWGVPITPYDGQTAAASLADSIKNTNPQGTILIVGHSDTVPDLVARLCQCSVDPIVDSDFGNLYHVELAADGSVLQAEQSANY